MSIPRTGSSREAPKLGAGLKINTFFGDVEPLVVKPRIAWILLQCSNTKGYELLAAGELESFKEGKSRKITVVSIHRYIARRLAEADGNACVAAIAPSSCGIRSRTLIEGAAP